MSNGDMEIRRIARRKLRWLPRQRLIHMCFIFVGAALNLLPRRAVFLLLLTCEALRFKGRDRLATAYQPYAVAFLAKRPSWRFSEPLSRLFPKSAAMVLLGIGAYREASSLICAEAQVAHSPDMAKTMARALFELGEFRQARDEFLRGVRSEELQRSPSLAFFKGMLDIIDGDQVSALESMRWACRKRPILMRPHQNIAARSISDYVPNTLDVLCGAAGRLFDLCNFTGQRVTHVGRGEIGIRLFARALAAQAELRKQPAPALSPELARLLEKLEIPFGELRIIPEEWTTQIGHLGMLDILFRMRDLGWWSGKPVFVVRSSLIANRAFFRLFERFGRILLIGETVSELVGEELLSLQRWCGMNFNAFQLPNGETVAWQEAGALAIAQWEGERRGLPLRDEYDRIYHSSAEAAESLQRMREHFGMKPDDWYVCLHTRDASHYGELAGTGQTHRNSPIGAFADAIRFITGQGGWVIKLGGPNSPKAPVLERTVDYAHSSFRSELMDIILIRNAKAFIGTTSGLTNVAISFGIPSAIVNGITTDAQLWDSNVRFALKPVRLADGTMLTQAQLTSSPWRWRVFDAAVLGRSGAYPETNTSDEICAAVAEVCALAGDRTAVFEQEYDVKDLLVRWKEQLAFPQYYGSSRPSLYYLRKHERELLAKADDPSVDVGPKRQRAANG